MIQRKKKLFKPRRSLGSVVLTTSAFLVFLGIIWHVYQGNIAQNQADARVPLIQTDAQPYKIKPQEEGGLKIAHRDVEVIKQIEEPFAGRNRSNAETFVFSTAPVNNPALINATQSSKTLLSAVDEGYNKASSGLPSIADVNNAADVVTTEMKNEAKLALLYNNKDTKTLRREIESEKIHLIEDKKTSKVVPSADALIDEAVAETAEILTPEVVVKKETVQVPVEKTTNPIVTSGNYRVQLGAVRSNDLAKSEWTRIKSKLPNLLSALSLNVEAADLGEKGTYYRIQAGSLSKEKATEICAQIKAQNIAGCLVKKIN